MLFFSLPYTYNLLPMVVPVVELVHIHELCWYHYFTTSKSES